MQYVWYSPIHRSIIMKDGLKFITVVDGELFVTRTDGERVIHELSVKSWVIQMLGLVQTILRMDREAQTSQFGWKMFTVVEMKIHWSIATTTGGGAAILATTHMMWACLVWTVSSNDL